MKKQRKVSKILLRELVEIRCANENLLKHYHLMVNAELPTEEAERRDVIFCQIQKLEKATARVKKFMLKGDL